MSLKLVALTTETTHHAFFVWKLAAAHGVELVLTEAPATLPAVTPHPYERERDAFEREELLRGGPRTVAEAAATRAVASVNEPRALAALREVAPDIIVVFGTGRLGPECYGLAPSVISVHGGDPERYRGLDSHLWSILDRAFDAIVTTVHHVDRTLDTGPIVARRAVPIAPRMELRELRAANTRVAVDLVLEAVQQLERSGSIPATPQARSGRYRPAMPSELKDICVRIFREHTASL